MKKCKNCGADCAESGNPAEIYFSIPFTKIEVRIWNWGKKFYDDYCQDCLIDLQNKPTHDAYKAGQEDGYMAAMNEHQF